MKLKLYSLYFLALIVVASSCKTASKLYEKGRYDEAVDLAAKKLQKDPDDPKLLDVLKKSYRFAVDDHESRIRNYSANSNELKWEWIYNEYADLQRLYESIYHSPEVFRLVNPTDYSSYMTTYAEKAGTTRYDRGIALMNEDNRDSYKRAYREFEMALRFIPGDLSIRQKKEDAFNFAVTNVVVLPLEESGFQYSSYSYNFRNFDNSLYQHLRNQGNNEFIRYYTPMEARGRDMRVDQVVDTRFNHFNIGRVYDEKSYRDVYKEIVVKETVYRPDSIVKEYARVHAKIATVKRTMRSEGLMKVIVKDHDNRWIWGEEYRGQHFWTTEFYTYTGDIRALSDSDKALINRREESAPREDEIIRCIMDELQNKVECGVRDYFNRLR